MANITIQSLEVESTALNQLSPGEMEKVVGGFLGLDWGFNRTDVGSLLMQILGAIKDINDTFKSVIVTVDGIKRVRTSPN
jgi:hypothetical protein